MTEIFKGTNDELDEIKSALEAAHSTAQPSAVETVPLAKRCQAAEVQQRGSALLATVRAR